MKYNTYLFTCQVKWQVKRYLTLLLAASMVKLQEKVKELRRRMGWAQEDLAHEIGVSLSTVQRWESKGGNPTRLARRELNKLFQASGINNLNTEKRL